LELRAVFCGEGVDVFFGDEDDEFVTAPEQYLAHRERGKQMSAGATPSDHKSQPPLPATARLEVTISPPWASRKGPFDRLKAQRL
jgi:hypothetical protein